MATRVTIKPGSPQPPRRTNYRSRRRGAWAVFFAFIALLVIAAVALVLTLWSGVTLSSDPVALARLQTQPFAGSLESAVAHGPDGRRIPLAVDGGRLTPLAPVRAGELISVDVTVRRPGIVAWALGSTRTEHLTVRAPVAHVVSNWLTVPSGTPVRVSFDKPVRAVAYGSAGHLVRQPLGGPARSVTVIGQSVVGSIEVAAAVRPWERLSAPVTVRWFPPPGLSASAVALVHPAPGTRMSPDERIRITLSRPVAAVFGSSVPKLVPAIDGTWRQTGVHTLVFTPTGLGAPLFGGVRIVLPRAVTLASARGISTAAATEISWSTPPASTLRLEQLLAQQGYLPLTWHPAAGAAVPRSAGAQLAAAVRPPHGSFSWRYPNTPHQLQRLWSEGHANTIVRGAVMMFENEHGLTTDGIAGPLVWHQLLTDALSGRRHTAAYSYVLVHTQLPQQLELWSGGHVVLTSPGNTGIASRPTQPGTFPVFEHIPVGTMSGTNPDGSHYHDPGIKWISYFNGGDALHEFPRASFGTPQSLGCVELPAAAAKAVYPYTPIGTLVTIENA